MKFVEKKLSNLINITGIVNIHFFEFPKDFYTSSDSHPFYELIYVSSGNLYIDSDIYCGKINKKQMIIHYPNENHSLYCEKNCSPEVIIIGFNCDNNNLYDFANYPTTLNESEIKNLAEIIKEGRNVFKPPFDKPTYDMKKKENTIYGAEQILKIMLEYFLIKILRKNINIEKSIEEKKEKLAINEIINYLDENFTEKVSIDELAFIFNTNRSTLCKEFKKTKKTTINEYINNLKLSKAKKLLSNANKSITCIAEDLGYNSIHYFTRFFKQKTGFSPVEFRKNNY